MNDLINGTRKHSLDDHLEANNALKHNSDIANLAAAIASIAWRKRVIAKHKAHLDEEIAHMEEAEAAIRDLAKEIEEGDEKTVQEIRKAYDSWHFPDFKEPSR